VKYRLGEIQTVQHGMGTSTFEGIGFSILNENEGPIVTFGYLDPVDAAAARTLIADAVSKAELVVGT
jgi:hypothetical protein